MLRQVPKIGQFHPFRRFCSSNRENDLVKVDLNEKTGVSIVSLNRLPVNGLDLHLFISLNGVLDELLKDRSRGVVLTSSAKNVFCAGLDFTEISKPKKERFREFWSSFQEVWLKLYGSPFPIAVAINGHAPAGGAVIALACEYRVMCPDYTIGINEPQLGVVLPPWILESFTNVINSRYSELHGSLGTLLSTSEALKIGLVDEEARNKEEAIEKCLKYLEQCRRVSYEARALTKQGFRSKTLRLLEDRRKEDLDFYTTWFARPEVQMILNDYVESIRSRKKEMGRTL